MGFLILGIGIMTVIGTYQLDTQFVRKPDQFVSDYQKYMCLVQVVEGKSADARPLAFTENRRWVNGNVDMTDYVLAWQDIPKCRNEKVVLPI